MNINKNMMEQLDENQIHCQCPEKSEVPPEREHLYSEEEKIGMNHEPNKCKGTNEIKQYKRGDKEIYLCSCCNLSSDVILTPQ